MGEGRQGFGSEGRLNPIVVEALRGGARESAHRGACAVVDGDGHLVAAIGDVERLVFPRSAVKLVQALPLVASGAADLLGLNDAHLAVACASHEGEPAHTDAVEAMLARAGLDAGALECGTHWPYLQAAQHALVAAGRTASALHNNCSGKHAGFLCLARHMADGDVAAYAKGYVGASHPVMQAVTASLAAATGCDPATLPAGIDGCSIPAYAYPLRNLALAFARVATGRGLDGDAAAAAARLRRAVARHPHLVGGTRRFDTRVIERFGERAYVKVGAEGVFCAALPAQGLGVAIKIDDGATPRAAEVAMAAVLEALLPLDDGDAAWLRELSDVALRNWNQLEVGRLRATDELRERLAR